MAKDCPHAIEDFRDGDLDYIWSLWTLCRTQMRYHFGGVAGLDYPAVLQTAKVFGLKVTPYDMAGLQALEADVISEQSEHQKKEQGFGHGGKKVHGV